MFPIGVPLYVPTASCVLPSNGQRASRPVFGVDGSVLKVKSAEGCQIASCILGFDTVMVKSIGNQARERHAVVRDQGC